MQRRNCAATTTPLGAATVILRGCAQFATAKAHRSAASKAAWELSRAAGVMNPDYVEGGAANPMGARALYLYANGQDTPYRIHGTNQPGWIGHAISSGCIRLTNEDIIDLYSHVKMGALVVVLGPKQGVSRIAAVGRSRPIRATAVSAQQTKGSTRLGDAKNWPSSCQSMASG